MKTIKPPKLRRGQKIGVIALSTPASKLNPKYRKRAYERLQDLLGVEIIEAPNLDVLDGHSAGTVKERVQSLHQFFKRKDIAAIMSFWGGFNTHQILEHLDFELIKKNPKILIGYSDTNTLLSTITQKKGLITFNGPAVITFAKPVIPEETLSCLKKILFEDSESYTFPASSSSSDNLWWEKDKMEFLPHQGLLTYRKGRAEGRIEGGNIGTLLTLAGTPYFPSLKGKILFVEDDEGESSQTFDRFFTQLRQMGAFKQIKGLIIGRCCRSNGFTESDSLEMILDVALKGYKFPVLTGFDIGHSDPLLTLPIGVKVSLDATKKKVTLLESATA